MRKALVSGLLILTMIGASVSGAGPAGADPTLSGEASAFGATLTISDAEVLPPTPEVTVTAPPFPADDAAETTIAVPADPVAVNGTLIANAAVHQTNDLTSALEVETQALAGPYNARAFGQAEDLEVLIDAVADDVPLVEADAVRGEVVAVCSGNTVEYSANSEAVNLVVAGQAALGDAVNGIIDQLFPGLDPLDPIVNVEETVVTELPDGLAVDALVITILEAADAEVGLIQVRIGHAELSGVTCGPTGPPPECSDGIDNDGDGTIDFPADDNCESPTDPTERPECSDQIDNDDPEDDLADTDDPGCHTDGDPNNPDSFDPSDDNETDGECINTIDDDDDGGADREDLECYDGPKRPENFRPDNTEDSGPGTLARTGTAVPTAAAAGLGLAAMAMLALRRRSTTV